MPLQRKREIPAPAAHRLQPPVVRPPSGAGPVAVPAKPVSSRRPEPAATRGQIIQRVTYKTVVYRPDVVDDQARFFEEAKRDMGANWAPGRSEEYIKEIGLSDAVIGDADSLSTAEKSRWKDFDKAVNTDLDLLAGVDAAIAQQATTLEGLIPQLKISDKSGEVSAALGLIQDAIEQVPKKWSIEKLTGLNRIDTLFTEYLKLRPWIAVPDDLLARRREAAQGPLKKGAQKNLVKLENSEKIRKDKLESRVLELQLAPAVAELRNIAAKVKEKIRSSAAEQYARGNTGHVSIKSSMTKNKLYLGEIETTKALRSVGQKGKGVLWASPWSPGVNKAFLEGGVASGSVYKLKTALPPQLKLLAQSGDGARFKDAVKNKTTKDFWPFWNSLENPPRFTIYTEELVYLMEKGYKLHEFKRKGGKGDQQIMVAPGQLAGVTSAYSGR
jgi:hypothetical protein